MFWVELVLPWVCADMLGKGEEREEMKGREGGERNTGFNPDGCTRYLDSETRKAALLVPTSAQ